MRTGHPPKSDQLEWLYSLDFTYHLRGIDLTRSPHCRKNETSNKVALAMVVRIGAADEECRSLRREVCMTLAEYWYSVDAENPVVCDVE